MTRVPAPEIESIVLKALHEHVEAAAGGKQPTPADDRDLIERHVERIVIKPDAIELHLFGEGAVVEEAEPSRTQLVLPWSGGAFTAVKGILHEPSQRPPMTIEARDTLLGAVAKACGWIDDLVEGRVNSFGEIAKREGKIERHIRNLVWLAFVSPQIISAIIERSAPTDLTVTNLAKALPYSWNKQAQQVGLAERPQTSAR